MRVQGSNILRLFFRYICYLPAGRSVSWKTVTEVLKMLPEVTVFHDTDRPKAGK